MANIATRAVTGSGDNVLIGGFIVGGQGKKKIIVRGLGPSIGFDGKRLAGTVDDPVIELHKADGSLVTANDNWKETQQAEIQASGLAPKDDREAAIIGNYAPGNYTAILRGKAETTGIGLVEVYKLK
ncbi:MAG: hypothetical protein H0X73_03070 [Chthoniobacterales bacterium]|nr:hypothetical protein [Chthoniobacterales bacterium]